MPELSQWLNHQKLLVIYEPFQCLCFIKVAMFYAVFVPQTCELGEGDTKLSIEELIFHEIKEASKALKKFKGSRMKTFEDREKALEFLRNPERLDESFIEDLSISSNDLAASLEKLTIQSSSSTSSPQRNNDNNNTNDDKGKEDSGSEYPSAKPDLLNRLRRRIEEGKYDEVEDIIWSNPRTLVTVCDSAVYLMAGPKYNACHIAARANKPDLTALILDTISNTSFVRKLYPKEPDQNLQDRVNHLLDSYLNTPDPRQGNTPLHFACKLGCYRVVRILLTFEGCDLTLKDSAGRTAEESICIQYVEDPKIGSLPVIRKKIKDMFKGHLNTPLHRDQLKKRLILAKRRNRSLITDSDISFSDDSFSSDLV